MLRIGDLVRVVDRLEGVVNTEPITIGTVCRVVDIIGDELELRKLASPSSIPYWYPMDAVELCKYELGHADETTAMFLSDEDALKDRKLFVHNLGVLLSQAREKILSAELDDNEIVTVTYKGGTTKRINVNMDSYLAIVKDVSLRV